MTVEPFTADPDSGTFHQGGTPPVSALGWMGRGCSLRGAALPSPFLLPDSRLSLATPALLTTIDVIPAMSAGRLVKGQRSTTKAPMYASVPTKVQGWGYKAL